MQATPWSATRRMERAISEAPSQSAAAKAARRNLKNPEGVIGVTPMPVRNRAREMALGWTARVSQAPQKVRNGGLR